MHIINTSLPHPLIPLDQWGIHLHQPQNISWHYQHAYDSSTGCKCSNDDHSTWSINYTTHSTNNSTHMYMLETTFVLISI